MDSVGGQNHAGQESEEQIQVNELRKRVCEHEPLAEQSDLERKEETKILYVMLQGQKEAVDDTTLRRFLRARSHNVEKATLFFLKYWRWRKEYVPLGYIPESEVSNELAKGKIFIQGEDKQGRPVGVILSGKHFASDRDLEEFKRFVVYGFDKICSRMRNGAEKFVIIASLEGWGYKNADIRGYLSALEILQEYYPERLGKAILVHVPSLFRAAWKVVYPFIDPVTKEKIIFVEDKKMKETLLKDIDESQLPEIFGGQLPLVPAQDC